MRDLTSRRRATPSDVDGIFRRDLNPEESDPAEGQVSLRSEADDIFERVTEIGDQAIRAWWNFDVRGWGYGYITRYRADTPTAGLPWHTDSGAGRSAIKTAISVQLSDPDDYEGGDLHLQMGSHIRPMPRTRGTVVFPGWQIHRVPPLTSGVRWSLTARTFGPPLR